MGGSGTTTVSTRILPAERLLLEAISRAEGLTLSQFLRRASVAAALLAARQVDPATRHRREADAEVAQVRRALGALVSPGESDSCANHDTASMDAGKPKNRNQLPT